jgi:hypothetical protein
VTPVLRFPTGEHVDPFLIETGFPPDHPIHDPDECRFLGWVTLELNHAVVCGPNKSRLNAIARLGQAIEMRRLIHYGVEP